MLDGLRMYDSDYGDSSDDSRLDVVPNASSSDDSTDNAGPVSVVVVIQKILIFPIQWPFFFLFSQLFLYIGVPDLLNIRSNAIQEIIQHICAEIMRVLRQVFQFLQFLCMQIDSHHFWIGFIPSSFVL